MRPLTIAQIHAPTLSIPSLSRGILVGSAKVSSSLHRRQPLRSPAAEAGTRRITAAAGVFGAVACMLGSSAKASNSSEDFVKETVSSRDIVVFSKSYCPYCARVKSLFEETKKPFSVIDLDEREDGEDIQNALAKLVGRWTVPQVFIKGEHIGGCDDTVGAYRSGKLDKLLAEIN